MDDNEIIATFGEEFDAKTVPAGMLRAVKFSPAMHVDKRTPDGRKIHKAGFAVENLPAPMAFQFSHQPAHLGSVPVGRVDTLNILKNGKAEGYGWIIDTPAGQLAALLIDKKVQKGMSADLSATKVEFNHDPKTDKLEIDFMESAFRGITGVAKPAFHDAKAMLSDEDIVAAIEDIIASMTDDLQASLEALPEMLEVELSEPTVDYVSDPDLAASVVVLPDLKADHFADPALAEPTPLQVSPDGHVFGHIATWGECHIGIDGRCITAPQSRTNYASFAQRKRRTDAGTHVWTGPLVLGQGHAPGHLSIEATNEFYGNACRAWADVAIGEDALGIWVSGAVRPGISEADLHAGAMSSVSGHWKRKNGAMELLAILSVNAPGFAIPVTKAFADAEGMFDLAAAGALAPAPMQTFDHPALSAILASVDALRTQMENERAEREIEAVLASLDA